MPGSCDASFGAACWPGSGLAFWPDEVSAVKQCLRLDRKLSPRPEAVAAYQNLFENYRKIHDVLAEYTNKNNTEKCENDQNSVNRFGGVIFAMNFIKDILISEDLRNCEIALMDINPERLNNSVVVTRMTAEKLGVAANYSATTDLHDAVSGADYVITLFRAAAPWIIRESNRIFRANMAWTRWLGTRPGPAEFSAVCAL